MRQRPSAIGLLVPLALAGALLLPAGAAQAEPQEPPAQEAPEAAAAPAQEEQPPAAEAPAQTKKSFWERLWLRKGKSARPAAEAEPQAAGEADPSATAPPPAPAAVAPVPRSVPAPAPAVTAPATRPARTAPATQPAPAPPPAAAPLEDPAALREAERAHREEVERTERMAAASRNLSRMQARLRGSAAGLDPAVRPYLDLVDRGQATASQINDFAVILARRGQHEDALVYQDEALRIDPKDPTLWINLGILQRQLRRDSPAGASFKRAISLDPSNAAAHYNLGAVYDAQRNYDAAVEEYRIALTLDPSLGDPNVNPQAVNNEQLMVVKLLNYQQQAGALGLPLVQKGVGNAGAAPSKDASKGKAESKKKASAAQQPAPPPQR